ncbi:MAG: hypothetical protein ACOC8E_05215 [Planctomycetota bacterium]
MQRAVICLLCAVLVLPLAALAAEDPDVPTVREDRPRVFLRAKAWDGPSVEKIKTWMKRPEYKTRAKKLGEKYARYEGYNNRLAVSWMMSGDEAAGKRALQRFKKHRISGRTPSYWGIDATRAAACYDWLHDHPDWDEESRAEKIKHLEQWGTKAMRYLAGRPATPFYSRQSGAFCALTCIALALHGDSPKADDMVRFAHDYLVNKFGTIRDVEDGATCGGTYGYMHEFNDLACLVAAWRSATDWDAAAWIKEHQGNWLERQMQFQIWTTYPNGWFVKDGDVWSGAHTDRSKFRMPIDIIADMYKSGPGRTFALQMARRWPKWGGWPSDYHTVYLWQFFVFNNPELKPEPLATLGRADVFSPKLHGIVCWRDSWKPDATVIHFKCGESVDHHGTWDQGKFTIFKRTPLAIKNGAYIGYGSSHHRYYKSPWSANCVVFTGPKYAGQQPHIDFDGSHSWKEWKAARDRRYKRRPTGVLLETEATDDFARALGDLSASVPGETTWSRELVFLGYKYLIVRDRVKVGGQVDRHRWTLHTINEPTLDGPLAVADNEPGRLFCRTLLPKNARLTKVGGPGHEYDYNGSNRAPKGKKELPPEMMLGDWRLDVEPADGAKECTYVHVLFPTDTKTDEMPACSVERDGKKLTVTVGGLKHVFGGE